jgi:hypothetical protein
VSHKRTVRLALKCPADQPLGCPGTLTLKVRIRGHLTKLGAVLVAVPKGKTIKSTMHVSAKVLARVHKRRFKTLLALTQLDPVKGRRHKNITLTLLKARR